MNIQIGRNQTVWIWKTEPINDMLDWCIDALDVNNWWHMPPLPGKHYQRLKFKNDSDMMLFILKWS